MPEDTFTNRLRWWLQRTNFDTDPFALSEADQERKYLPGLFVDKPYLYDILGDVNRLQPSFLLARRGEGKTATREMVAYECEKLSLRDRVLPIRYYDFSHLLEITGNDPARITAKHHAQAIIRTSLNVLADSVPAPYFEQIKGEDRKLFVTYIKQFADPVSALPLLKLLGNETAEIPLLSMSAVEIFNSFIKLMLQLGSSETQHYEAIYILIDRVDESELGPNAAIDILKPLISQKPLLEAPNVAFKFFLPLEVGESLLKTVELRKDRVSIQQIRWDQDSLRRMIDQRINYYSNGQKTSFEDLCLYPIRQKALRKLIEACEGSPRQLIQLCDRMVHLHVKRNKDTFLDNVDLAEALDETIQKREIDRIRFSGPPESSSSEETGGTPAKGLYLNEGGHVWIDGQLVDPPLTDLEFLLLRTLYKKPNDIVQTIEMINSIWPGSTGDDQNLRKLIGRLRKRLEPNGTAEEPRFIRNIKGRGYWLNLDR